MTTASKTPAAPKARRGRPQGDHEARKKAVLAAAFTVIAEEGYASVSLRKVAAQMGGTTGTVTYYFANKEELLAALANDLYAQYDHLIQMPDDAPVDLNALASNWLTWNYDHSPDLWRVIVQLLAYAPQEPAFASLVQQWTHHFLDAFTALLARGQQEGVVRKDIEASLLADQFSAMGDGLVMLMATDPKRFDPERLQALTAAAIALLKP